MNAETVRQQALLAAIAAGEPVESGLRETGERLHRGLQAYRANADAHADRALGASFPTVRKMLGQALFMRLACEFRQVHPPVRGDLGEWGDAFPGWLGAHAGLVEWPWLADCARVDLGVHRCERARDAALDLGSLSLLQDHDPDLLVIGLAPGIEVVDSAWPIASIHAAHRLEGPAAESGFAVVRDLIRARRGEQALVARQGWRAVVHSVDPATASWTRDLQAGRALGTALARAGDDFNFADWLARSLRESWFERLFTRVDEAA